jgi:hypothetical protein
MVSKRGVVVFTAQVVSVDGECCTVDYDGLQVSDVRLRAVVNGEQSKILVTPKVGSYVMVVSLTDDMTQLIVSAFSEVDKIEIDTGKIVLNGGQNGGIVNITQLTQKLNDMVNMFNAHTHAVTTIGGATTSPVVPAALFNASDYNDDKILH